MFEEVLPTDLIEESAKVLGVQEKRRKLDVPCLVRALVMTGGSRRFGHQAAVMETYFDLKAPKVCRSAFYQWFTEGLAALTADLGARACAWAAKQEPHLPGPLADVRDWRVVDSSTVKVPDRLRDVLPGAGEYASLKVHREYSLGVENIVDYHITPGRQHDAPQLVVDERRRNTGLLVDLGYASHDMLRACDQHDVQVVIRLKRGWHVWLDDAVTEDTMASWLDDLSLEFDTAFDLSALESRKSTDPLDVDVTLGDPSEILRMRLVTVYTKKGHCAFLTNLPRKTHPPEIIGLLYRLRWCIEVDNKLSKSGFKLDHIDATKVPSVLALVHSAMIASILANGIVHLTHLSRGLKGKRRRAIKKPPLHGLLVARSLSTSAPRIAELLSNPDATEADWDERASLIVHLAGDPNWRKRPSPIDVVKGRTHRLVDLRRYARQPVSALKALN